MGSYEQSSQWLKNELYSFQLKNEPREIFEDTKSSKGLTVVQEGSPVLTNTFIICFFLEKNQCCSLKVKIQSKLIRDKGYTFFIGIISPVDLLGLTGALMGSSVLTVVQVGSPGRFHFQLISKEKFPLIYTKRVGNGRPKGSILKGRISELLGLGLKWAHRSSQAFKKYSPRLYYFQRNNQSSEIIKDKKSTKRLMGQKGS